MASYNVLTEPWISVQMLSGEEKVFGILDTLKQAQLIKKIYDYSPLFEYGIHRLLTVFLMDALQPNNEDDIENLLDQGQFNMEKINSYVQQCQQDGECFDLFDKDKPFLQAKFDEKWDSGKNIKPVASLIHNVPGGNNPVHFDHHLEISHSFSSAVCAKALCAVNVFCTSGLQGPSSVNGAPPLYFLIKGKNLFEMLASNIIPNKQVEKDCNLLPVWRSKKEVVPGEKVARASLLFGMSDVIY